MRTGINLGGKTGRNIGSVSPDTTNSSTAEKRIVPIILNLQRDSTIGGGNPTFAIAGVQTLLFQNREQKSR